MTDADAYARQQGFPDAKTMMAWHRHRQQSLRKPQDNALGQPLDEKQVRDATMWHPRVLFQWIADQVGKATGQ